MFNIPALFKAVINKMIPKIRKMVSGARIRYEKEGFNLDLTYITDRILAMSFPAAGFQAIYRNHIDTVGFCSIKVAWFLNEKHSDKYMVYNLSEKSYNEAKFYNWVSVASKVGKSAVFVARSPLASSTSLVSSLLRYLQLLER